MRLTGITDNLEQTEYENFFSIIVSLIQRVYTIDLFALGYYGDVINTMNRCPFSRCKKGIGCIVAKILCKPGQSRPGNGAGMGSCLEHAG